MATVQSSVSVISVLVEFLKTLQIPIDPAEQIITQFFNFTNEQTGCTTVLEAFFTYR